MVVHLILPALFLTIAATEVGGVGTPELDALHDIFLSTSGPLWNNKSGWSNFEVVSRNSSDWADLDPCSTDDPWTGIKCTGAKISEISMPSNNLQGRFPSTPWTGFPYLKILNFDFNNLNGSAPSSLCLLTNLSSLSARGNLMMGSLPECIDSCSRLRNIDFSSEAPGEGGIIINHYTMSLSGSLPHSLCNLHELEKLRFQGTYGLSGSIPQCLAANQPFLSVVDLHANKIQGTIPEALSNLTNLIDLDLGNNTISGSIPVSIVQPPLKYLDLSMNRITGVMPHNVGDNLPVALALEKVYLYDNSITGSIPDSFGKNNPFLQVVDLHSNNLAGPIPNTLCEIGSTLSELKLSSNQITGTIPDCLPNRHPNLRIIDMGSNALKGSIPFSICEISYNLNTIDVSNNSLTGSIPDCQNRTGWPLLENFLLSNNKLQGTLPSLICESAVMMDRMEMMNNKIQGTIPSCYGTSFPKLRSLFLHSNKLHGHIDFTWALGSLNAVIMSNNQALAGSLPSSIFYQQGKSANPAENAVLETVVIEGTHIAGSLPKGVCGASNLKQLALSGNKLTGSIPHCLFAMKALESFHVADNKLSGSIPDSIGEMERLSEIDIGNNHLEGKIPKSFGRISDQIVNAHLQLNFFSCDLPQSVTDWKKAPGFNEVDMLSGNLFGCSKHESEALGLSLDPNSGLANADSVGIAYVCADKGEEALDIATALCVLLPTALASIWLWYNGGLRFSAWREIIALVVSSEGQEVELQRAAREMICLTLSVVVIALVAATIVLPLAASATSPFICQYFAETTVGYKRYNDPNLSFGVGCTVVLGLAASLMVWFRRALTSAGRVQPRVSRFSLIIGRAAVSGPGENALLRISESGSEGTDEQSFDGGSNHNDPDDAALKAAEELIDTLAADDEIPEPDIEDIPEEELRAAWSISARAGTRSNTFKERSCLFFSVTLRIVFVCVLSLGPNYLYVLLTTSKEISSEPKEYGLVAITIFKIYLTTAVLPFFSRSTVDMVVPPTLAALRFHSRTTTTVVLFAVAGIFIPILLILATDPRCFYYEWIEPKTPETNQVSVPYCSIIEDDGSCSQYTDAVTESTYTSISEYSGAKCVASVLFIYVPVFRCGVFFTALVPAILELVIVPNVVPWCYRRRHQSILARKGLVLLRTMALNTALHIPHDDLSSHPSRVAMRSIAVNPGFDQSAMGHDYVRESEVNPFVTRVNYLARRVAERGFSQITITMLVALTFGLAAPYIALIAALSAILQLCHHLVLLEQVQEQFHDNLFIRVPFFVPRAVGVTIIATTLLVWLAGSFDYLDPTLLGIGSAVTVGFLGIVFRLTRKFCCRRDTTGTVSESFPSSSFLFSPLLTDRASYKKEPDIITEELGYMRSGPLELPMETSNH